MTDLDPKLTFDAFVVGPASRLASDAARRAADSPGTSYNPLFIYSASGLGKSHILAAIAPVPPQAHKNLGDQAYAHGDHEGARVQYEKAVKLSPRLGDDIYLRLGTMAYKSNDRDVALLLWRRALGLNPHNDAVRSNLDMISGE